MNTCTPPWATRTTVGTKAGGIFLGEGGFQKTCTDAYVCQFSLKSHNRQGKPGVHVSYRKEHGPGALARVVGQNVNQVPFIPNGG